MPFTVKHVAGALLAFIFLLFIPSDTFSQNNAFASADSVRIQLLAMGKPGQTIELAREKVLEILETPNACGAWFQDANSNPAGVFATLRFAVDENGPAYITALRTASGGLLFKHPYSGSTVENAGLNAVITLNAHGPFFVDSAVLLRQPMIGSALHRDGWQNLRIASYLGNTLPARITTLLHELGHVVGRIPDDSDELSGQSTRNTEQVLHYCRGAIKTSLRHAQISVANGAN